MYVPLVPAQLPAPPELLVVLLLIILLFGADKIPKLARSSGEAIGEFKKGKQDIEEDLDEDSSENNETSEDGGEN